MLFTLPNRWITIWILVSQVTVLSYIASLRPSHLSYTRRYSESTIVTVPDGNTDIKQKKQPIIEYIRLPEKQIALIKRLKALKTGEDAEALAKKLYNQFEQDHANEMMNLPSDSINVKSLLKSERSPSFQRIRRMKENRYFEVKEEANPYLRFVLNLVNDDDRLLTKELDRVMYYGKIGKEKWHDDLNRRFYPMMTRQALSRYYSDVIPCKKALETIARYSPLIQSNAVTGYWAKLLWEEPYSADIMALDPQASRRKIKHFPGIQDGTIKDIKDHPNRNLLLINPAAGASFKAIRPFFQGKYICFIGKDNFLDCGLLAPGKEFDDFQLIERVRLPVYRKQLYALYIYERVKPFKEISKEEWIELLKVEEEMKKKLQEEAEAEGDELADEEEEEDEDDENTLNFFSSGSMADGGSRGLLHSGGGDDEEEEEGEEYDDDDEGDDRGMTYAEEKYR